MIGEDKASWKDVFEAKYEIVKEAFIKKEVNYKSKKGAVWKKDVSGGG